MDVLDKSTRTYIFIQVVHLSVGPGLLKYSDMYPQYDMTYTALKVLLLISIRKVETELVNANNQATSSRQGGMRSCYKSLSQAIGTGSFNVIKVFVQAPVDMFPGSHYTHPSYNSHNIVHSFIVFLAITASSICLRSMLQSVLFND